MSRQPINRAAELAALKTCASKVLVASNGHHLRWARTTCASALASAGHDTAGADAMAVIIVRFAAGFAERANVLHAEFNRGAIA